MNSEIKEALKASLTVERPTVFAECGVSYKHPDGLLVIRYWEEASKLSGGFFSMDGVEVAKQVLQEQQVKTVIVLEYPVLVAMPVDQIESSHKKRKPKANARDLVQPFSDYEATDLMVSVLDTQHQNKCSLVDALATYWTANSFDDRAKAEAAGEVYLYLRSQSKRPLEAILQLWHTRAWSEVSRELFLQKIRQGYPCDSRFGTLAYVVSEINRFAAYNQVGFR
jgi:hypothetical protein